MNPLPPARFACPHPTQAAAELMPGGEAGDRPSPAARPHRGLLALLPAVLVAASLLTGCAEQPEAELVFISGDTHNTLDPQKLSWMHDARVVTQMYEPLVRVDFDAYEVEPAAAASWSVSDDGLTYTFQLRKDAKWSNGDPVTAADFVAAWRRALTPDSAADYSKLLFDIEGAKAFYDWRADQLEQYRDIRGRAGGQAGDTAADAAETMWDLTLARFDETVGIEAVDETTLRVTLARPVPQFLDTLSMPVFMPVHRDSLDAARRVRADTGMQETDAGYFADASRLVTNGPYRLAGRAVRQWLLLEANEHYWNADAVGPRSIRQDIIGDPLSAVQAFTDGRADWHCNVPSAHEVARQLLAADRDDVFVTPLAGTYFYNFNCLPRIDGEPNPLADARVRRALAMAIDRDAIVNRITRAGQQTARTFVPPFAFDDYRPPVDAGVDVDPDAAATLLADAGYPAGDGLGELSLLVNTGSGHETIAQFVVAQWREHLGVSIPVEAVESTDFADRLDEQQYTIARAAWIGDYPDPSTFLAKMAADSENNDTKYAGERFNDLLEQAAETRDPARRIELLQQAEAQLLEDQPMAMVFHYVNIDLARPWLAEIDRNEWGRWRMWEFPGKPE